MKKPNQFQNAVLIILAAGMLYTNVSDVLGALPMETPLTFARRIHALRPEKGEFESSAQYESRCANVPWDSAKVVYLLLDSTITWSKSTYDADSEVFLMKIPYGGDELFMEACPISSEHLCLLQQDIKYKGSKTSQNAFGATIAVTKRNITRCTASFITGIDNYRYSLRDSLIKSLATATDSVRVREREWLSGSSPSSPEMERWERHVQMLEDSLTDLVESGTMKSLHLQIPVKRQYARTFRQNVQLVLGITLRSPINDICLLKKHKDATFHTPFEDEVSEYRFQCRLVEVIAYDTIKNREVNRIRP